MKIVVLDGYTLNPGDLSWESFKQFGEITVYARTSYDRSREDLIIERVGDAEIVLTNKTPLSREALSKIFGNIRLLSYRVKLQESLAMEELVKQQVELYKH